MAAWHVASSACWRRQSNSSARQLRRIVSIGIFIKLARKSNIPAYIIPVEIPPGGANTLKHCAAAAWLYWRHPALAYWLAQRGNVAVCHINICSKSAAQAAIPAYIDTALFLRHAARRPWRILPGWPSANSSKCHNNPCRYATMRRIKYYFVAAL